jgi:translation elongation factor EF-Tu-like GTPase
MDIPETYAVREVSDLLKKSPDMAMKNIVGKVIESYDKLMKFQNQPKRKEDKPELLKIRDTAEAKGLPVYDALNEHGLIKNPSEDFELGAKD